MIRLRLRIIVSRALVEGSGPAQAWLRLRLRLVSTKFFKYIISNASGQNGTVLPSPNQTVRMYTVM